MMETNEENEIKSQPEYDVFYSSSEDEARQIAVKACQECTCERKIERPKIEKHLIFLGLLIPMCLILAIVLVMILADGSWKYLICVGLFLPLLFLLKYIAFLWVKLYQKFAPEKVRRSCLFYPSCSQYMLLAIEKYGFWKGFWKGLKRLGRCHYPNGGEDYP